MIRWLARTATVACMATTVVSCASRAAEPDAAIDAERVTRDVGPIPDAFAPDASIGEDAPIPQIFAGYLPGIPSRWPLGLAAMCDSFGEAHPCEHGELRQAIAYGQLVDIPIGTTAWLYRLNTVVVDGIALGPGDGAHCNHWTYDANALADGEFVVFGPAGPVFQYDRDAYYDGVSREHTDGNRPCGGVTRAVLCCH